MRFLPALLILVSACASPSVSYLGRPRQDVRAGGIDFAVFVRPGEAEVIRMGYLPRRERARVPALMMEAAERASGCRAIPYSLKSRIPGDTGEGRVTLDC